jgi:hypothetical protein
MARLVERAALDPEFERELLQRRAGAAVGVGIVLDAADGLALDSLPAEDLAELVRHTRERVWRTPGSLARAAGVAVAALGIGFIGSTGALAADPTDTDGDGLTDEYETSVSLTDPQNPDSDFDGLSDGYELLECATVYGEPSDPLNPDSDGDGLPDGWEDLFCVPTACEEGLDPTDPSGPCGAEGDPDGDGYPNTEEYWWGSDPTDPASWPYEISGDIAVDPWRYELSGCAAAAGGSLAALGLPLAAALLALRKRWSASAPGRTIEARP